MNRKRTLNCLALIASIFALNISQAEDSIPSYYDLLQESKPAPNPPGPIYSEAESNSKEQTTTVAYDVKSKQVINMEYKAKKTNLKNDAPQKGVVFSEDSYDDFAEGDAFLLGAITPPTQLTATTSFPYNTIYKLVMRFNVSGTDYFYVCSGWSVGDFHIATAGHCVYNFDPDGNGNDSDQKWADDVWVYPGQTDLVVPNGCGGQCADRPYGMAKSVFMRSYSGWATDHNFDHDWAVVTLDRNMGQRVGWMGRTSTIPSAVNFSGYPSETPYVPAGVNVQYKGFDSNNVASSTTNRIELDAFIYGGHSGGPSWVYNSGTGDRHVVGIHSTSNRMGSAHDTLLTSGKRSDINTWMADDVTARPPTDKPDLFEELFDGLPHKSIDKTIIGKLEDLTVDFRILNAGFANANNNINVDFYASTNEFISTFDTLLGSKTVSGINGVFQYSAKQETVSIPNSLAAGDYTVGMIMSTNGEYPDDEQCDGNNCSNIISIANQILTVEECTADSHESDNSSGDSTLLSTTSTNHSICSSVDADWYRFTVSTNPHAITLETNGPTGDTQMRLLASDGTSLIEFNDDSGNNLMSKITRECGTDELGPATYYVRINSYNQSIIDDYNIRVTKVDCVTDLIFKNGFE